MDDKTTHSRVPFRRYVTLLAKYLSPQWRPVILLAILLFSQTGLRLAGPQLLARFIDSALAAATVGKLQQLALMYVTVVTLTQVTDGAGQWLSVLIGQNACNGLREDLFSHCIRLDMSFHKEKRQGEMIERVDGTVSALNDFFSTMVVGLVADAVMLCGVLVTLYRTDLSVGFSLTVFSLAALSVLARISTVAQPHWKALRGIMEEFYGSLGEWLTGMEDIRANGASAWVLRGFHRRLRKWYRRERKTQFFDYSMWMSSILLFGLATALGMALSAYLYFRGSITVGTAYLIFSYIAMIRRPIEALRRNFQRLQRAGASISRVDEILAVQPKVKDPGPSAVSVALPLGPLGVEFDDVTFAYDDGEDSVLSGITFTLQPGRTLGLLGRTGSGKTTMARLIFRQYDVLSGEIRIGGRAVDSVRLGDLRSRVGFVTQDVQLFNATVRDNLTFFRRNVSDERVISVLHDLGLAPWLSSLSDGLDSELCAGNLGLSAGEAQLLAFARLLLQDPGPGLVILDEASSRLDPATERLMERATNKALAGRTGIIIAHRLSTVERADDILILDGGRILEHGSRTLLAADTASRFHYLLRTGLEEVMA